MKHIRIYSILLGLILAGCQLIAQQLPPAPGPAPEVNLPSPYRFTLANGLKVILVENHKLPRVTFSLVLDNDPIFEGDKAGVLSALGSMLEKGTTSLDEEAFAEAVDMLGANFFTFSGGAYMQGLSKHKDAMAKLMSDALLNPAFPQEAFDREVKQSLSGLAIRSDNPNSISCRAVGALVYGKDHPYGEFETEDTWKSLTVDDVKEVYNTYFKPNQAYLVMVGDLDPQGAEQLAKTYFGVWQQGEVPNHSYKRPQAPEKRYVGLVDRSTSTQSIVDVTYPVELSLGDPDIYAARIMNHVLGGGGSGRLFRNLREAHSYTYGAYSGLEDDQLVGSFSASASVRSAVTDSAIQEILNEMERIRQNPVTEEELNNAKNYLMGSFARSLENPQNVASYSLNIDRYELPKDFFQNYLKNLEAVTLEDVQKAARRFIHPDRAIIVVVGKGSEIAEGLSRFGEIQYLSKMAEKIEPPKKELPKGLTADRLISKYLVASGGTPARAKIEDLTFSYEATLMGQPATLVQRYRLPNMYHQELNVANGMFVQKSTTDGKAGIEFNSQAGKQALEGPELREMILRANYFYFIDFEENGYKAELTAMDRIEGKDVFAVEVTDPENQVSTQYFDAESGLLVRRLRTVENAGGQKAVQIVDYQDYKEVNGIKFPHTVLQQVGPQKLAFTLKELKVNTGLKKKDFPTKM